MTFLNVKYNFDIITNFWSFQDGSQSAEEGFNPQHFYHWGDPNFQLWNCHKTHALCLFLSSTVTPSMLSFKNHFYTTKKLENQSKM